LKDHRSRLGEILRSKCDVGSAIEPGVSAGDEGTKLGPDCFHIQRIRTPNPAGNDPLGTSKTAQLAIARGLAETCQSTSVTVNSVLPGPTASEGVTQFVSSLAAENKISAKEFEKQFFKDARPTSILQRFIEPDEIANVVAFVCSPLASAINGAAVRADGGVVRSIG
jgi:NAD(P)-dependent dehydrogenase (short-subunit alcohol dehydrogenase family)